MLVAADWLTTRMFPPLLAALLTVTMWKLVTGGLHLAASPTAWTG